VKPLTGGSATGTLIGGSAAFYRFAIPANATATISVSGSALLHSVVVRVR
jgi:hypothetical protein